MGVATMVDSFTFQRWNVKLDQLQMYKEFMEANNLKINKTELARRMKVDRKTVSKYLDGYQKPSTHAKPSSLDKYKETIENLLYGKTKQVFFYKRVLWQYLKDNFNLKCAASTFRHYINRNPRFREYFNVVVKTNHVKNDHIVRYETAPGQQAQLDWKESMEITLKTGEVVSINVLVLLLSYSRYKLYKLTLNKDQNTLLDALTEMFEKINGVPKEILTDNMKTVMDVSRTRHFKGKVNAKFEAYAKDFGFKVKTCIAETPETKGKVESKMRLLNEIYAYNGKLDFVELNNLI